jgi:hypothetical protein
MTASMNYVVSFAVCAVMLIAARMRTEGTAASPA